RPSAHTRAHLDLVHSLAFSPEGDLLASGGYREVKLWRRPKNVLKFQLPFTASNGVQSLAASADGRWLATASADGRVHLFDSTRGQEVRVFGARPSSGAATSDEPAAPDKAQSLQPSYAAAPEDGPSPRP